MPFKSDAQRRAAYANMSKKQRLKCSETESRHRRSRRRRKI